MPSPRRTVLIAWLIASLLIPGHGLAWGREGHRIVARIAAKNLWQATRDKLRAILGVTTDAALASAMAEAAIWPDRIDRAATGTSRWHFINIPLGEPFSIDGHCANHDCVVDQIENMRHRLQKNQTGFSLLAPTLNGQAVRQPTPISRCAVDGLVGYGRSSGEPKAV